MTSKKQKNIIIIMLAVSAALIIVLLTAGFVAGDKDYKPSGWVLKTYGDSVALYNGEEVDSVFGEIALDNLPDEDIRLLNAGIAFPTKEEALRAIEDYDG